MENSVKRLVIGLVALGAVLSFTSVPGVFTVDENNYLVNVLALRQGRLTVRNTEGLPASPELLFFDPTNEFRRIRSTPVSSTAPPLYALVALPFSFFGWRGLAALNTIAYLLTILLVFRYTERYASERSTPWIAAAAFGLGGYAIEYAIGLWPHALSFCLVTAAVVCASGVVDEKPARRLISASAAAGFLLAMATGVRYQNAAVLVMVGGAILLLAPARRWAASVAYAAGAIVPLAISAAINHARLDSWNPISKGSGYLTVPISGSAKSSLVEPLVMFWGQIVDYTARPALTAADVTPWLKYDAVTGTHLIFGAIAKKAFLQSAPWAILAFLMFAAAWLPLSRVAANRRRQLRFLSVAAVGMVGPFMVYGVARHDGLAFNARYFLELLPIAAIGLGFAIDGRLPARLRPSAVGAAVGGILAGAMLVITPGLGGPDNPWWVARQLAVMKLPLVLSGAAAIVWLLDAAGQRRPSLLAAVVGACIGWGFVVHGATDVGAATVMRSLNQARARALEEVVPDRAAIVAYWGAVNPVGPLLFTRDLVAVDIRADQGHDGAAVIQALLAQGRRVFLLNDGMPPELVRRAAGELRLVPVAHSKLPVVELRSSAE